MSDLTFIEKHKLEKLLAMADGVVLDFSNRTFKEFVADSVGRDIYGSKYDYSSGSKANRLRAFWTIEPNYLVGKLLQDLLAYCATNGGVSHLIAECQPTVERMLRGASVEEIDAISPNEAGQEFELLAESIRTDISRNRPEVALDRLHTFVMRFLRVLCGKHGIEASREKPLHSLIGEYTKTLKSKGLIESVMTERILKSIISTMEAFNRVRNERSLAHDNRILSYSESLLIFNHVATAIRFIQSVESSAGIDPNNGSSESMQDDLPF